MLESWLFREREKIFDLVGQKDLKKIREKKTYDDSNINFLCLWKFNNGCWLWIMAGMIPIFQSLSQFSIFQVNDCNRSQMVEYQTPKIFQVTRLSLSLTIIGWLVWSIPIYAFLWWLIIIRSYDDSIIDYHGWQ